MKEFELLSRVLTMVVLIRYGENKIKVANRNDPKDLKTICVPPRLIEKVKDWLRNPKRIGAEMTVEEWVEIREYVHLVTLAIFEMDILASTPREMLLKASLYRILLDRLEKKLT